MYSCRFTTILKCLHAGFLIVELSLIVQCASFCECLKINQHTRFITVKEQASLHIWAVTCDSQQCGILIIVDSDKPVQPPFKLRSYKWCSVSSLTLIEYSSDKQRLWSDCLYVQADLRLCWSHIVGNPMPRLICTESIDFPARIYKVWMHAKALTKI